MFININIKESIKMSIRNSLVFAENNPIATHAIPSTSGQNHSSA